MKKTSFVFMALLLVGLALSGCEDSTYGNFTGNYSGDTGADTGTGSGATGSTGDTTYIDTGTGTGTTTDGSISVDTSNDDTTNDSNWMENDTSTSTTTTDEDDDMTSADDEDDSSISIETMTMYETNSREVNYYNDADGFYAYPSEIGGGREYPGVIIVHEGFGIDSDVEAYAERLASYGFNVLAIDLREEAGMATSNNNDEDNETQDMDDESSSMEDLDEQDAWRNINGAEAFLRDKGSENIALVSCTSQTTTFEAQASMATTSTTSASDDEGIIAFTSDENLCASADDMDSSDLGDSMEDTVEFLAMNLMNESDTAMMTDDDDN